MFGSCLYHWEAVDLFGRQGNSQDDGSDIAHRDCKSSLIQLNHGWPGHYAMHCVEPLVELKGPSHEQSNICKIHYQKL